MRLAAIDDQIREDELHLLRLMPAAWLKPGAACRFDAVNVVSGWFRGEFHAISIRPLHGVLANPSATCRSGVVDPLKANNSASVKTIVQPLPVITFTLVSGGLVISWPADAGNFAAWVKVYDRTDGPSGAATPSGEPAPPAKAEKPAEGAEKKAEN